MLAELRDLYDAEARLVNALPRLAQAATSDALRTAFETHLAEIEKQVERLDRVFEALGETPARKACHAMRGLVQEADALIAEVDYPEVRDAGLIAAAQKAEHYEIATYGTLVAWARRAEQWPIVELLEATLEEEKNADTLLTGLAEGGAAVEGFGVTEPINERARQS
jgi:ferritin-like metal-binding protein YciE